MVLGRPPGSDTLVLHASNPQQTKVGENDPFGQSEFGFMLLPIKFRLRSILRNPQRLHCQCLRHSRIPGPISICFEGGRRCIDGGAGCAVTIDGA